MTTRKGTQAPDNYAIAQERARAKSLHYAAPGTLDLSVDVPWSVRYPWAGERPTDRCLGQLRTAYVRVVTEPEGGKTWNSPPGRPSWKAIGVVCDVCSAFWHG